MARFRPRHLLYLLSLLILLSAMPEPVQAGPGHYRRSRVGKLFKKKKYRRHKRKRHRSKNIYKHRRTVPKDYIIRNPRHYRVW